MPLHDGSSHWSLSRRRGRHSAWLAGASVAALLLVMPVARAHPVGAAVTSSSATVAASQAAAAASAQAAAIAKQSASALTRAAQALQALQAAQNAARAAAAASSTSVTDGLSAGGLVVDPRVGFDASGNSTTTGLWSNISAPSQSTNGGQTIVTLTQSSQRAIATWQQFNVGRNTSVYFDQSAGTSSTGNSWIVLNRVDAAGVPSQILGQIKAEGTVLLINPNGIIFTGTSQINVHTLIAAAMDMNSFSGTANGAFKASGSAYLPVTVNGLTQTTANGTLILAPSDEANANSTFLGSGLFVNSGFSINGNQTGNSALFSAGLVPGQSNIGVRVEAGARIATDVSGFDNGGFVALLGPQVINAGSITTSAGQIILAAGSSVQIAEPPSGSSSTSTQVSNVVQAGSGISETLVYAPPAVSGGSLVLNDTGGTLVSARGNITLIGDAVDQFGIAEATTSITRPGSITIVANGTSSSNQVLFGGTSLTTILPDENGETIPSDPASLANFTAPRIDVAGAYVDFQPGSWVLAPSATMAVTGPGQGNKSDGSAPDPLGRVVLETGSTIDLSGLVTTRSVSDYLYTFKVTANDVADTPLAQALIGKTVTIDLLLSGTRADGETWVGSPLFASSGAGYLNNVTQGIDQLLTKGGSLTFGGAAVASVVNGLATAPFVDVLQVAGSNINVSGGLIQFTGAQIATTRLIGSDGRSYDIGSANPFIANALASGFTVAHSHWNVTDIYADPLGQGSHYKPGYVDGVSAGSLAITAINPILEGDLAGDIVIGTRQRQLAQAATGTGGAQATPDQLPSGAALSITLTAGSGSFDHAVNLAASPADILGPGFTLGSSLVLPTNAAGGITYATDRLSAFGLGSITISGADTLSMAAGASLSVLDGGSITLSGATRIDGTLTAHGGSISIGGVTASSSAAAAGTLPALTIGANALLDVSGRWINDAGLDGEGMTGQLYINGGSVSLSAYNLSQQIGTKPYNSSTEVVTAADRSGSILLQQGSVIDVSSGGYVGTNGKLATGAGGLPKGNGGNLSLLTYAGTWQSSTGVLSDGYKTSTVTYAPQTETNANVIMDGTIDAAGLSQGGTFTLQVPAISIEEGRRMSPPSPRAPRPAPWCCRPRSSPISGLAASSSPAPMAAPRSRPEPR